MSQCQTCTPLKGRVALVVRGPHAGKEVVIQYTSLTGNSYSVRMLKPTPVLERIHFGKNGYRSTDPKHAIVMVRKTSLKITDRTARPMVNEWQGEASRLLSKISGKTEAWARKTYSATATTI